MRKCGSPMNCHNQYFELGTKMFPTGFLWVHFDYGNSKNCHHNFGYGNSGENFSSRRKIGGGGFDVGRGGEWRRRGGGNPPVEILSYVREVGLWTKEGMTGVAKRRPMMASTVRLRKMDVSTNVNTGFPLPISMAIIITRKGLVRAALYFNFRVQVAISSTFDNRSRSAAPIRPSSSFSPPKPMSSSHSMISESEIAESS